MNEEDKLRQRSVALYFARFRLKKDKCMVKRRFLNSQCILKRRFLNSKGIVKRRFLNSKGMVKRRFLKSKCIVKRRFLNSHLPVFLSAARNMIRGGADIIYLRIKSNRICSISISFSLFLFPPLLFLCLAPATPLLSSPLPSLFLFLFIY